MPFASVVTTVVLAVALSVRNTFAPAIAAPCVEETVPLIVAVAVSWAEATGKGANVKSAKTNRKPERNRPEGHNFPDTILMGELSYSPGLKF